MLVCLKGATLVGAAAVVCAAYELLSSELPLLAPHCPATTQYCPVAQQSDPQATSPTPESQFMTFSAAPVQQPSCFRNKSYMLMSMFRCRCRSWCNTAILLLHPPMILSLTHQGTPPGRLSWSNKSGRMYSRSGPNRRDLRIVFRRGNDICLPVGASNYHLEELGWR